MRITSMSLLIGLLAVGSFVVLLSQSAHARPALQPAAYQNYSSSHPDGSYKYSTDDQRLEMRVTSALRRSLGPDASRIGVAVENGNVYLSGTIGSEREMKRAWQTASSVSGVNRVFIKNLQVVASEEQSASGYPHGYYPFMPRK